MKKICLILILIVSVFLIACGSAERGVVSGPDTTNVIIDLGQRETHSVSSSGTISSSRVEGDFGSTSVPSYITSVRCIVTDGTGGAALVDTTVNVTGLSSVTLNLNVPNGTNRVFTINAYDYNGYLTYQGVGSANLTGAPVTLQILMEYFYS